MNDSVIAYATHAPPPWYRWERCPLLPKFWYRPENEHNRLDWGFSWLLLSVWTGIALNLGFRVEIEDVEAHLQIHLPYLHIRFTVPFLPIQFRQRLWRTKPWPRNAK